MRKVTWKCDSCGTTETSEKGPADWYSVAISAKFRGYNGSGAQKLENKHTVDLCSSCTDRMEVMMDPKRWVKSDPRVADISKIG